jgi:hypothetical protein
MKQDTSYLGDSVYAQNDGNYYIQVYLDNGIGPHNIIMMEPEVVLAFIRFVMRTAPELAEEVKGHI